MRIQLLVIAFLVLIGSARAQSKIQWTYSYNETSNLLEITAVLAEGWHLYSQHVDNEIGPVPTSFAFQENPQVKFIGKVTEPTPIQKYDENFEAMLDFFEGQVVFTQRVSIKGSTTISGSVTYMVCNETMCLPPVDEQFTIEIK